MARPAPLRLVPAVLVAVALLAGCAPEAAPAPSQGDSDTAPSSAAPTPVITAPVSPEAGGAAPSDASGVVSTTVIPSDCSGILGAAARADLEGVPLNDPSFGPAGALTSGVLRCIWADPEADTSRIETTIGFAQENAVIDFMNELGTIGFTCYRPDAGVRCEKTWRNERFPVTDGRTLYFRDGVLVDTRFSHLAPEGYTSGIVASLWPAGAATPAPAP